MNRLDLAQGYKYGARCEGQTHNYTLVNKTTIVIRWGFLNSRL